MCWSVDPNGMAQDALHMRENLSLFGVDQARPAKANPSDCAAWSCRR